ncbi:hypothetical protein ABPG77_010581 [Micractinium sp. CCAP 211/92]
MAPERPTIAGANSEQGHRGGGGAGALPMGLRAEHKTMQHLVVEAGYPLEEHFVTTADGYVLGVYRIPGCRGSSASGFGSGRSRGGGTGSSSLLGSGSGRSRGDSAQRRPPVLLLHGVLDSSAAWVLNEPSQSLGFILADAGFDVWLGNSRGNGFSRNHTGLDPGKAEFWDFSWDEMASFDVPAMVSRVLQQNGSPQLAYVGHSQGTTQLFAALAAQPALRDRLSVAVMLAPAVHMRGIHAPAMQILAAMDADRLPCLTAAQPLPCIALKQEAADIFGQLCRTTPLACASIITFIAGFNSANVNMTRLPTMVQYAPSGTSVKNIVHWAQAIRKSRQRQQPLFQMYDYDNVCYTPTGLPRTCNMRVYNSLEPPSYDLGAIAAPPLAIFHGGRDKLADVQDVATLLRALPSEAVVYTQFEPTYEHIDFTWGIDACVRIYPAVLQLLQRYLAA